MVEAVYAVRRATEEDAPAIGIVHVLAWQAAYRGQMPDNYLDALSAEDRAGMWRRAIAEPPGQRSVLVAEGDGGVVGFAAVGPSGTEVIGELYAINVDPSAWGRGAGRALLKGAESELRALGYDEAGLWVLHGNDRARRFYAAGWWIDERSDRTQEVLGVTVPEIRYRGNLTSRL